VAMDDLVHAAALAELRWGAGREAQDFVFLEIGTSVAAGLVCDGRLVRGTANLAGEFGHVFVDPDGPLCSCGRCGCLEPLVSAGGLLQQVRVQLLGHPASSLCALPPDELTPGAVLRAAQAGDSLASAVAGRAAHALGLALAGLIDLLNPRLVVCSGPVLADDWLRQRVVAEVEARAKPVTLKSFKGLLPTRLDPELSTLLGGASLAWDSLPGQAAASPT
jgi:glucokinase